MTNFKEGDHPRDKEGKFIDKDDDLIIVSGNELGSYSNIEELREKAVEYYKKNLAGETVNNVELGKVIFTNGGYDKPKSFSADYRKLLLFPYLKEIVANGGLINEGNDVKGRDRNYWYLIENKVVLDNIKLSVRINIRQDNNGKFCYDHYIVERASSTNLPTNADGDKELITPTIKQNSINVKQNLELNLNIVKEEYLTKSDRVQQTFLIKR